MKTHPCLQPTCFCNFLALRKPVPDIEERHLIVSNSATFCKKVGVCSIREQRLAQGSRVPESEENCPQNLVPRFLCPLEGATGEDFRVQVKSCTQVLVPVPGRY